MIKYTVYALINKDSRIYVGFSKFIDRRLKEHNSGYIFSTKGYRPWKLLYSEIVNNRNGARFREKYLKSGIGKEFLKNIVKPR